MWFWLFWVCFPFTILLVFYIRWLLKTMESMSEEDFVLDKEEAIATEEDAS